MTTIPDRQPAVVGVRQSFAATFGGYVPPDWTLDAECTRHDPRIFYPPKGGSRIDEKALRICGSCIVREKCLEDALAFESGDVDTGDGAVRGGVYGVRGGKTAPQRKKILRERSKRKPRVNAVDKKPAVLETYRTTELTVPEIAELHDVSQTSVNRWTRDAGLPPRSRVGRQEGAA